MALPLLDVPAKESWKLAYGSATDVWPPRTTRPVILMLLLVRSVEFPSSFASWPERLQNKCRDLDEPEDI